MQEFIESPYSTIKGNFFTLDEFIATHCSGHDYFNHWEGFNLAKEDIDHFFRVFPPHSLSSREEEILLITTLSDYLIVMMENDHSTLQHELTHAEHYLNNNLFATRVVNVLKYLDFKTQVMPLFNKLIHAKYKADYLHLFDELIAYTLTPDMNGEIEEVFGELAGTIRNLRTYLYEHDDKIKERHNE